MLQPISKELMIDVKLLINPKKFYKAKHYAEAANPRDLEMTIAGCQRPVVNNYAVEVSNLKDNISIILQTLKNKCVINIDPAQQDLEVVNDHLGEVLLNLRNKMKKSYDGIVGFVTGGRAYDPANKFAEKSVKLTDAICEFMELERIPSTKILEQNIDKNSKGFDVYSHRQNVVLSNGIIDNFAKIETASKENLQNIGEQYFDIFEVSPYAPIKIVNEILPDKSTNLRFISR
ncbi:MAG: hypothetical protein IKN42_03780 [Elusimicrobia bacterium]|nr:hypothetical protein [Elusimicrobiota bacterium]